MFGVMYVNKAATALGNWGGGGASYTFILMPESYVTTLRISPCRLTDLPFLARGGHCLYPVQDGWNNIQAEVFLKITLSSVC